MNDRGEVLTIGQLARRTGVPVRTIRFWSDIGVIPPSDRTAGGYRLYDSEAVARLDLVRTLRELGLDLPTVQRVLARQATVAEVARAHVAALDAEIRILRARRAVLRSVAERASTIEEMKLMHELARLSAAERRRVIDEFVDEVFAGTDPETPGAAIANRMRQLPAELPDDPTAEQVDAWMELAELVADPDFRRRAREMAVAGTSTDTGTGTGTGTDVPKPPPYDPQAVLDRVRAAMAEGVAPHSARGREVLDRLIDPGMPADERVRLADQIERFTDRRVERYWQLLGVINGTPPFEPSVPAFEWLITAIRAHAEGGA
ncbi:MerR family transcriptional regulator [Sphaerimonospora thailandensis]|uniref:MerR family transcriptional regulator n=1 Tax=Sphaerimonospora thailandensis TaxID=795644 RepID=A0A8J3R6S7_9ACTN|nr:MerR family transcriptional regulator [Sphaerimonospora thailandensis]GIH68880.1 MerR family transcriptional regulator [Sphaerimonospora thailandensis]